MIRFSLNNSFSYFERSLNAHYDGESGSGSSLGSTLAGIGGIVNAAANIGTAVYNAVTAGHKMKKQYKYNKLLMDQQQEYARQNWNMENEYNLPVNQVQRLKDAGINPAVYFGNNGGSTGEAGSISGPSSGSVDAVMPNVNFGNAIQDGINSYFDMKLRQNQIAISDEKLEQERMLTAYKKAWLENEYPFQQRANISESELRAFNATMHLDISSADDIIFEDGFPSGYVDDKGKYVPFNNYQRSLANSFVQDRLNVQSNLMTQPRAGEVLSQQIEMTNQQINDVINQMKNRNILTNAQANQLSAAAYFYKTQADSLSYEIEQLKLTEDSSGRNASTRMKEFQANLADLQKDYQQWQLQMRKKYGEVEEVINQIVLPVGRFVGQVAGAALMLHPATRGLGIAASFLGTASARPQDNPFVPMNGYSQNNTFSYP